MVVAGAAVVAVALLVLTLPPLLRRGRGRAAVTPALVILTGAAAITFVSYLAYLVRCADAGCGFDSSDTVGGFAPWWRQNDSWQWGGQLALAGVGLVLSSIAFALAARGRRSAGRAVSVARVAVGLWALVIFLLPGLWEIFVIS
jgi:hypothetical protein